MPPCPRDARHRAGNLPSQPRVWNSRPRSSVKAFGRHSRGAVQHHFLVAQAGYSGTTRHDRTCTTRLDAPPQKTSPTACDAGGRCEGSTQPLPHRARHRSPARPRIGARAGRCVWLGSGFRTRGGSSRKCRPSRALMMNSRRMSRSTTRPFRLPHKQPLPLSARDLLSRPSGT